MEEPTCVGATVNVVLLASVPEIKSLSTKWWTPCGKLDASNCTAPPGPAVTVASSVGVE
jgi:hypothetical protein